MSGTNRYRETAQFHLTREQLGRLKSLSDLTRVPMAQHLRDALEAYLTDRRTQEAWERCRVAAAVRAYAAAARSVPTDDVIECDKELPT